MSVNLSLSNANSTVIPQKKETAAVKRNDFFHASFFHLYFFLIYEVALQRFSMQIVKERHVYPELIRRNNRIGINRF